MAAAIPELLPPGTRILQQFETTSVVPLLPTLPAVIVGVCREVHELRDDEGLLNTDILVSGPALATADNEEASYTSMASLNLKVRVNNGAVQTFEMSAAATDMTAQSIANAINSATPAPVDFAAYVFEDDGGLKYLQLRTLTSGSDKTIQIVGGTMLTKLGWGANRIFYGLGNYDQDYKEIKQSAFPDPFGIGEERDIDEDSIRIFLDLGGASPLEMLRTQSFLRRDSYSSDPNYGVLPYDDGDGDTTTPYVDIVDSTGAAVQLLGTATPAIVTGLTDIETTPVYIHGESLSLQIDGAPPQSLKFVGQPVVSAVSTSWTFATIQSGTMVININGTDVTVTFGGAVADIDDVITDINDQSVSDLGINVAYRCDQYGKADVAGDYLGLFYGADPTNIVPDTEVKVETQANAAAGDIMELAGTVTADHTQDLQGTNPHANSPMGSITDQINELFSSTVASSSGNSLVLTSPSKGTESKIEIGNTSSAVGLPQPTPTTLLGLDVGAGFANNQTFGNPFAVRAGDSLYGDGTWLGDIIEVQPGAVQGRVRLNNEVSTVGYWTAWYIIAKTLDAHDPTTEWGITVPTPDLWIDATGDVHVHHDFVRDTSGAPVSVVNAPMYMMFTSLRKDVTSDAAEPGLLAYSDESLLADEVGPITTDNPLVYGMWLAMQTAPTVTIYGIGLSQITDDKPNGTIEAYAEALNYLESQTVYAIATMTSDQDVASIVKPHVLAMSDPDAGEPRIGIAHTARPLRVADTIVASGNDGDSDPTPGAPYLFDTKIPTLSQDLLSEGVDPNSIDISDGLFLDFASNATRWNVTGSVSGGSILTINTAFAPGQNDDNFYGTMTDIADVEGLVSESFSLNIRGALVTDTDDEVVTLYNRGQALGTRRMWLLFCEKLRATIGGIEQEIDGFYGGAVKAGFVTGLTPGTPMSRMPMPVFLGVTGTNDTFKKSQLNKIAAGGVDILYQPQEGAAVQSRHQLTTDQSTIQKAEQSITTALDFVELYFKQNLSPYAGRYNLSDTVIASLSMVFEGLAQLLVDQFRVVRSVAPTSLTQDENDPRKMKATVRVTPFYPGNTFEITIIV